MQSIVVQKFGGTSVGTLERISHVADLVLGATKKGKKVVVVVSAMAGETDRLHTLGKHFGDELPSREVDVLVAAGEQISAALLSLAITSKGGSSICLLGHQIPIRTDREFGSAKILFTSPQRIARHLAEGRILVVAGYQGVTEDGDLTTLGRGGSDLTAVAIAAALEAEVCQIFTDVAGVYTADPQICPDARLIEKISYDEMLELASLGAKVLQARSVALAKRYRVPLQVLSTFENSKGTWVKGEEKSMEATVVSAISCDRKESKISVRHLPDPIQSATTLFSALAQANVVVDVIVQDRSVDGKTNLTFTLPRADFSKAIKIVEQIGQGHRDIVIQSNDRIAKISAVGLGMRTHSGVAATLFETLAREKIEVLAVSTSDIKISCVIDDGSAELAVRALHEAFHLTKEPN